MDSPRPSTLLQSQSQFSISLAEREAVPSCPLGWQELAPGLSRLASTIRFVVSHQQLPYWLEFFYQVLQVSRGKP